jgi:hypothetical protein
MILLDYWPLKRFESQKDNVFLWQVKEKLPFFILSAAFSIITLRARYKPYGKDFLLRPDYTKAYINRGIVYLKKGNKTLGCSDAGKACALGNCKTLKTARGIGLCH